MQTANPNASDHLPLPWLSVPPTPFAAEDEASAPGAPRPLSFCGLRSKSLLWLAAVTLAASCWCCTPTCAAAPKSIRGRLAQIPVLP